jgi:hypothetical protein
VGVDQRGGAGSGPPSPRTRRTDKTRRIPSPRTNRARRVPPLVLTGHAASLVLRCGRCSRSTPTSAPRAPSASSTPGSASSRSAPRSTLNPPPGSATPPDGTRRPWSPFLSACQPACKASPALLLPLPTPLLQLHTPPALLLPHTPPAASTRASRAVTAAHSRAALAHRLGSSRTRRCRQRNRA